MRKQQIVRKQNYINKFKNVIGTNDIKNYLYNEYILNKKSICQLEKETGFSYTFISNLIDKYDLPRRKRKEANLLVMKDRIVTEETRNKLSLVNKGNKLSGEAKIKISKSRISSYKNNDVIRKNHLEGQRKRYLRDRTKHEIIANEVLNYSCFEYETQKILFNKYIVDFYLPNENIAIEIDSVYHKIYCSKRDKERDEFLNSNGVKVVRIMNDDIERFYNKLNKIVGGV